MKERIVNRVKEERQQLGITQADLAEALGVSRQSVISIEKGHYVPSLALALRMAAFFHCPTESLFQLEEEKPHAR